jgi:hypothetical protein
VVVVAAGDVSGVVDPAAVVGAPAVSGALDRPDAPVPDEVMHADLRGAGLQGGGEGVAASLLRGGRQYAAPPGNTWQVRPSGWSLVGFQVWASPQLIDQRCCWSWVTMLSIRGVRQPRANSRSGPGPTRRPTTPRCTGLLTVSTVPGAAAKPRQPPQGPRVMAPRGSSAAALSERWGRRPRTRTVPTPRARRPVR